MLKFAEVGRPILAIVIGAFLGSCLFTFWYAKGYSYMLNDPEVCVNCHVMRDNYRSWQVSSHRSATCNDCHVPHSLLRKYMSKAVNGYRHSFAFTFGPPDVIRIRESNRRILNHNCLGCHENLVNHLAVVQDPDRPCTFCHAGVGHGR